MRINVVSSEQLVVREMSSTHLSAEKQRRSENVSWSAETVQQCSGCGRLGSSVVLAAVVVVVVVVVVGWGGGGGGGGGCCRVVAGGDGWWWVVVPYHQR